MIRAASITALVCLLVLTAYLPSTHPPERFLAQIRNEYQAMEQVWGEPHALRTLDRALRLQEAARQGTPMPAGASPWAASGADGALPNEMVVLHQRFFGNRYFRAIDAFLLLAAFRLSAALEWLPWIAAFVVAALADGAIGRVIKSREFLQHDPERFALYASGSILLSCAAITALVVPAQIHPLSSPIAMVALAVLWGRSISHFHRRA